MVELFGVERRITLRLLAYWETLRGTRTMPTEDDIDPNYLQDLWDNCFLIHVKDLNQPDYNFTYLGQAIADAYKYGLSPDDPVTPLNSKSLATGYAKVMETHKPLIEEGEFRNLHNEIVKYRQCLLPLGEGEEVQAIFGGMRFKIFASE